MKIKLLILSLFFWMGSFAQSVPNTTNFALSDVTSVVTGIGSNDLVECFAHAVDAYFDPTYKGDKTNLYNFRNYTIPSATEPTVTTTTSTSITDISASSGGNVTSDGGASVTERGVCWSTSANPTTANSKTSDGTGTGSYSSSLTSLSASTTYHVRAYATNSVGTAYGSDLTFITSATCQINIYSSFSCTPYSLDISIACSGAYSVNVEFIVNDCNGLPVNAEIFDSVGNYIGSEVVNGTWSGKVFTGIGTLTTPLGNEYRINITSYL